MNTGLNNASRVVQSSQTDIHPRLAQLIQRHLAHPYQKPIVAHNQHAFARACDWIDTRNNSLILDSGCGVGESTIRLAQYYPDALVIGVDKSAVRLAKAGNRLPENALLLRADLQDFWRLAVQSNWRLERHYLLYPNPWPKPEHIQRRWHGSPLWPFILTLGGRLELRTNWRLYAQEFVQVLHWSGIEAEFECYQTEEILTPFERKYQYSGQALWRCVVDIPADVHLPDVQD